jgi:hypothetical protein
MLQHNIVYLLIEYAILENLYFGKEQQRHFYVSLYPPDVKVLLITNMEVTKITFY